MYVPKDLDDIYAALNRGIDRFDLSALAHMSWPRLVQVVEMPGSPARLLFRLDGKRDVHMDLSQRRVVSLTIFGKGFDNFDFLIHFQHLFKLLFWKTDETHLHTGYLPPTLREVRIDGDRDGEYITDLDFCSSLRNLESLCLHDVRIKNEAALKYCFKLQHLDIADCGLTDLSCIAGLTGLKSLGLFRNQITDLSPIRHLIEKGIRIANDNHPVHSGKTEAYKYFIAVADNPLQNPPMDVVIMGNRAVLDYMDGRRVFRGVKQELEVEGTRLEVEVPFEVLAEGEERVKDYLWDVNKVFRYRRYHLARTGRSELFNINPTAS